MKDLFLSYVSSWLWASSDSPSWVLSSLSGLNNQPWSWTHSSSVEGSVEMSCDDSCKDMFWKGCPLIPTWLVCLCLSSFFFFFFFFVKARNVLLPDAYGLSTTCPYGDQTTLSPMESTLACHSCSCVYSPFLYEGAGFCEAKSWSPTSLSNLP